MRQTPTEPLPVITLSHVRTLGGGGQAALADLGFSVLPGEIVTLLGGGPGPATALALLAGFARPEAGEVAVNGFALSRTPPHRRSLGVVARPLALFPHVTVADHAGFAPHVTAAQAEAMLRRLGLASFAGRLPQSLSPELQLRVALARALAPMPPVLLLDDPLASIPAPARPAAKALLRELAAELRLAVLHATDDIGAALGLSDRIGVMQGGRLLQIDAPRALYEHPATLSVATGLGPVNRLAGTKLDQEDDIARIRITGGVVVEARLVDDLPDGAACVVTIRPERIAVASVEASEMGEGAMPARLIEALFEGEQTRLRFAIGRGPEATAEVIASRPASLPLPRGGSVALAWQPHHAHAFRPEAA